MAIVCIVYVIAYSLVIIRTDSIIIIILILHLSVTSVT